MIVIIAELPNINFVARLYELQCFSHPNDDITDETIDTSDLILPDSISFILVFKFRADDFRKRVCVR